MNHLETLDIDPRAHDMPSLSNNIVMVLHYEKSKL